MGDATEADVLLRAVLKETRDGGRLRVLTRDRIEKYLSEMEEFRSTVRAFLETEEGQEFCKGDSRRDES